MSIHPETGRAAHERLLEVLDEKADLMRENAKLRAGVTLIAIELDEMKLGDVSKALRAVSKALRAVSKALRAVLAAATEEQP